MIPLLGFIPGFGMIRRSITLALCAASFWAGVKFVQLQQADACRAAGGVWSDRGFCKGSAP